MRLAVLSVAVLFAITSCEKPAKHSAPAIKDLVNKLHPVPVGYTYDLTQSDGDGLYETTPGDSIFINPYQSIIGYLPDTTKFYSILYLESGDDFYPCLKVFSKDGKLIYYATVSYADCAAGSCGVDSCISTIQVTDQASVRQYVKMVYSECDSLGNAIAGTGKVDERSRVATVNLSGQVELEPETEK